jgi:hypothetical protein
MEAQIPAPLVEVSDARMGRWMESPLHLLVQLLEKQKLKVLERPRELQLAILSDHESRESIPDIRTHWAVHRARASYLLLVATGK